MNGSSVQKAFFKPNINKSYIVHLTNTNLNVRLAFTKFMPIYTEATYQNNAQIQQKCIDSITGSIIYIFSQKLQANPIYKKMLKDIIKDIVEDQKIKTIEYVTEEFKQLKGKIGSFMKQIDQFLRDTYNNMQKKNRFDLTKTPKMLLFNLNTKFMKTYTVFN